MENNHIYYRLSKNKNKLTKLTQTEIFNYLKELYPLSDIRFHESIYKGTYIRLICHHTCQNIRVELNKYKLFNNREKVEDGKKIEDISKNSYIFYMNNIDPNIIKKFKLQIYR